MEVHDFIMKTEKIMRKKENTKDLINILIELRNMYIKDNKYEEVKNIFNKINKLGYEFIDTENGTTCELIKPNKTNDIW